MLLMTCSWSSGMRDICISRSYCYVATFYYIPYLLECKMRVCLKFLYDVPNPTMCRAKTSCKICTLVGYYTAQRGNSTLTFRDNLWAPYSKVKKFKRENQARLKLTGSLLFLGNSSIA